MENGCSREEIREFYIDHDKIPLHMKLSYPPSPLENGKCPLLILQHGFTGHMEEPHLLAFEEAARRQGYAVLRSELYGHGMSGGAFKDHTILKWVSEMMTVIDYARSLDFVSDLYLSGHSQGGLVAALAGSMKQDVLKGLLLLSPALMIPEDARRGNLLGMTFDPENIPDSLQMDDRVLGGNYVRAAQFVQVEPVIRRFRKKVLIVHGDADESVPIQVALDAADLYSDVELEVIPGDTHCFDNHLDQAADAVGRFLGRMKEA